MTFANIALKNIRKKFGSYSIYFCSTVFSVVIFNLFCSMYYNPTFEKYRFGTGKMSVLFRGSAIAVLLFATVFVVYSGNYFLKTQKKEIALYSLLGMRKGQIATMMFLETFFIGLFAVAVGVLAGTFSAKYAVILLLRFMGESTAVAFSVDIRAIGVTLVAFVVLFGFSGIKAYKVIYKYTLIDLLYAEKQSDSVPRYSVPGALISLLLFACGYGISMQMNVDLGGLHLLKPTFISALFILTGTYLFFQNFVPFVVCNVKKRKKFYYQTSNFVGISQISFCLRGSARMFTVIALLTATTITMISASYSFYNVVGGEGTEAYAPFSYLAKNIDEKQHSRILDTIAQIGEVEVVADHKIELLNITLQNDQYAVKDQQTGEAIVGRSTSAYMISESMYLRIIDEVHAPKGKLSETRTDFRGGLKDTECFFIDGNAVPDYCKGLIGQKVNMEFHGLTTSFAVSGISLHKYIGALDLYKHPTIVVSDINYELYYSQAQQADIDTFYGFQFDDDMKSGKTVDAINEFIPIRFHFGGLPGNMSYIGIYKANFALFGSYAFIGFFLGALFLLASGSVMYYKLIMEAQEEKSRYLVLRKIGMKKSEIVGSVVKQLGLVYGMPLLVGLIHTLFGLLLYGRALGEMSKQTSAFEDALKIVLVYTLVYGTFYLLSTRNYYKIITSAKA